MNENEKDKYDWLFDNTERLKEKIRFKDRIEYRISGKLHNSTGPALIYFGDESEKTTSSKHYYLKGKELVYDEWKIEIRPVKLKKLQKKIKDQK